MTLSELSVRRPILTWMMTLALIVFGVLGYERLGVDQFPEMDFPILTVTALFEGASPEGMEEDVTDVLEEHFNSIAGVRSIRSKSMQGASEITVEFQLGVDLDIAKQEVRDKVARARFELPRTMETPIVSSFNPNEQPVLWVPLWLERSAVEASEYVRRTLNPQIETVPGVAGVAIFGREDRNIRIWLDAAQLRARGLASGDVLAAIRREHVEVPGGSVKSAQREFTVKTDAEFRSIEALGGLVVADVDGAQVRLRDVARIEDGSEDVETLARFNGRPTVGIGIIKQSGGNTVAIVDEVMRRLQQLKEVMPEGISFHDAKGFVDFSHGVREAVAETEFALLVGAVLAVLTVFVFLRRSRPTFIIALAIPISLVATFGVVWVAGFTLNTMTLLGMTLAVGVVVDDAIVVLENIERHREAGGDAWSAAISGSREIAFAATAASVSVAAVFLPTVFVEGVVGSFLGEFGLTVATSVMISLFVALTLTPMLAARMPPPSARSHGSLYHYLERSLLALEEGYRRVLHATLEHRAITVGVALASIGLAWVFATNLEGEFFPPSDAGLFFAQIEAPPGTPLAATLEYVKQDEAWFLAQPEVAGLFAAAGTAGGPSPYARANRGMLFGTLKPRAERERSVFDIIEEARRTLQAEPGRSIRIMNPGEMMGGSEAGFVIEIRGNLALSELDRMADEMIAELSTRGGLVDLTKSLKLGQPELRVVPDREKAAALGVDALAIAEAIQVMVGGADIAVFKEGGKRYDIRARLEEEARADRESIGSIYVRARSGEPVELRNVVRFETGAAPAEITRTNRQRSVTIRANLEDKTLGTAIAEAREIAAAVLPEGVSLELSGQAQAMQEGIDQLGIAIVLAILVIYMVLAAQFESLIHPLTVMLALPLAMVGALGGLWLFDQTMNLFSMIGIILLFGLVTKNSILLVDYANQLRESGLGKREAMERAAPVRMRPVLMTALSMIFGVLPAALGIGPGAESRMPMAIATAAGMLSSTVLTLLLVPVVYLLFDDAGDVVKRWTRRFFAGQAAAGAPRP